MEDGECESNIFKSTAYLKLRCCVKLSMSYEVFLFLPAFHSLTMQARSLSLPGIANDKIWEHSLGRESACLLFYFLFKYF